MKYESCIVKALGLGGAWPKSTYFTKCVAAALDQGLGEFTAEAQMQGLKVAIEQTGGMTMVAYVDMPKTEHYPGRTRWSYGVIQHHPGTYLVCSVTEREAGDGETDEKLVGVSAYMAATYIWAQIQKAEEAVSP
jgi:hypothetical protein